MQSPTRRDAITLFGIGTAVALMPERTGAANVNTSSPDVCGSLAGGREPRPLPFEPARLAGLSEKLMRSHWENNYIGSVRALNMIAERLAAAMRDPDFPPLVYGGLKREELHRVGSVVLHENYFANLGGDGKAGGAVLASLKMAYGTYEAWEAEFRRTAMSLAGGSGWCVLTYNLHTHELRNQWAWDHMHGAMSGVPLLVLDMYEHSYHMDYGSAAAQYVDAFMNNVNWEEVDRRFAQIRVA
jgi:superoxide dismutase, Fe-Mn family